MNKAKRSPKAAQFALVATLPVATLLQACGGDSEPATGLVTGVMTGIDVLVAEDFERLRGLSVGLITNQTGVDRSGASTIDRLHRAPEVDLVALFSPEHGIRGAADPGALVSDTVDRRTGLIVHSLYGQTRRPTDAMLAGLDALVFDIQGVGVRYYTYQWTMALAMSAAAGAGIEFIVLDRPNPIDGLSVQGNVLDPAFATFVGLYPVAMRHGLTGGELALLLNDHFALGARLTVVEMEGWERRMAFDDTGLGWISPSPNMPTALTALHYAGLCLFEGTNLSVGRGTDRPFEQIGAPWLDGQALAAWLRSQDLPGVRFEAVTFTPHGPGDGKFADEPLNGVRFIATDRGSYDPTRTAVAALTGVRTLHPERLEWTEAHFDRLAGTDRLRLAVQAGLEWPEIVSDWESQASDFRALRQPYLLYP